MEFNRSEIIRQAQHRIEDTLFRFSDSVTEDNVDTTETRAIATRWFEAKADKIYALMNHPYYQESEPFKVVYPVKVEGNLNIEQIDHFANCIETSENLFTDEWTNSKFLMLIVDKFRETFVSEKNVSFFNLYVKRYGFDLKAKPHEGQKVSKFIRKLATELGYTFVKAEDYAGDDYTISEREFAKYADALNPVKFERKCILSVDPADYLLMSHGNSWSSCYCINQNTWLGSTYRGCYSSGVWSYMTDKVTMILYTVSESVWCDYAEQPKITRQCVMYDDGGYMVNSRLYPQSNDKGAQATYDSIRKCSQQMIADTFGLPNFWKKSSEIEFTMSDDFAGYFDLDSFRSQCVASINTTSELAEVKDKDTKEVKKILPKRKVVGGKATCPCCGDYVDERYICNSCEHRSIVYCADCGSEIDTNEDDYIEWDGEYFCSDCYVTCEHCGQCVPRSETELVQARYEDYWCRECREDYGFYCEYHDRYESLDWYENYTEVKTKYGYHENWCNEAIEEDGAWYCEGCDEWFSSDYEYHEGSNGNLYCNDCWEEREEEENEES